jgi:hypothetical protein
MTRSSASWKALAIFGERHWVVGLEHVDRAEQVDRRVLVLDRPQGRLGQNGARPHRQQGDEGEGEAADGWPSRIIMPPLSRSQADRQAGLYFRKLSTSAAKAAGWSSMMKCSEPSIRLTLAEVIGA